MYEIEHGVPFGGNSLSALLNRMGVGDSFVAPMKKRNAICVTIQKYYRANAGSKFATRKIGDAEIRVWRLA